MCKSYCKVIPFSFRYLQSVGGGGREETSQSLSLASQIYHNFTLTYRHSSDDFFTLNGSNGVITYLAVLSGPAGVVNNLDFISCV